MDKEHAIKDLIELIDCFGGMMQNSGIVFQNKEESNFYLNMADNNHQEIQSKLRGLLQEKCCDGGPQWGHDWGCKKLP